MRQLKTVFLLTLLSGILLLFGYLLGGQVGLIIALIMAVIMNFGSYWFSDRLALAMSGAKEVTPDQEPRLHEIVDRVVAMAGMKKPRVYVITNDSPNAFATGRNESHAAVAATTGIMRILDDRELTAVLGHEMGHIRNKDILVSAIVATIAAAIMFLAFMGRWAMIFGGRDRNGGLIGLVAMLAMLILAPIAATMVRMAVSREREYGADRTGAEITHDPLALASALQKLQDSSAVRPMNVNPAMSHLFIVNPLGKVDFSSLFSTHPPTAKRIERLNEIARKGL
jgi:heat shock protein HtpX